MVEHARFHARPRARSTQPFDQHLSHELEEMRMMGSDPSEASQEMPFKDSDTEKPSAYLVHMRTFFVSILLLDGYEVEYDGSNGYPSARWIILSHKQRT